MATKSVNFKLDEKEVEDIKKVANIYHTTMTNVVKEAINEYIVKAKKDPYYRLTANVDEASEEESKEVLNAINELSDEDLSIVSIEHIKK